MEGSFFSSKKFFDEEILKGILIIGKNHKIDIRTVKMVFLLESFIRLKKKEKIKTVIRICKINDILAEYSNVPLIPITSSSNPPNKKKGIIMLITKPKTLVFFVLKIEESIKYNKEKNKKTNNPKKTISKEIMLSLRLFDMKCITGQKLTNKIKT